MGPRSLRGLVLGMFGVAALLLAVVFVLLLVSVVDLQNDSSSGRRSSDLLFQALEVERSVLDLETGLRGFVLTHEPRFLQPYMRAQAALPTELRTFGEFGVAAGAEHAVSAIANGINAYIAGYARPLIAMARRLTPAQQLNAVERGKPLIDRLRAQFSALDETEFASRTHRRAEVNSHASAALVIAGVGLGVSALLLLALAAYFLRGILRPMRTVADAAERLAAGDLTARVPQVGRGEVATLGQSFNQMAAALSDSQERMRAAVETAEAASAMKSNFVANMSHEIRTPLNGVVGMITLLGETGLSTEQSEYVEAARYSSDALLTVVNDVLDIAKIEAGRLELEQRDFDVYDMVEASCDMLAGSAMAKGIQVQPFIREDVPRAVCGDRARVSQILANLVSNAVKFTPEGEVTVEVTVASRTEDAITIRFEVSDTGIGIPPERIAEMFERFTQADAGTTREFGGTGLGLAISTQLARLMGGTLDAESELGQGSTFRVEIPFMPAHTDVVTAVPPDRLRDLRVLIVDDNATNRRIFEAYVASWGMRPATAADAAEAFGLLEEAAREGDPFEIALLDFNMAEATGLELARRITASPQLQQTRLILLTSSGQTGAADPAAGIRHYLTKPVRQSRLLDAIGAVIADGAPPIVKPAPHVTPARPEAVNGDLRVLVAEDQPVNWTVMERLLSKRGYVAANASDGNRALAMLESERFDLVFMDCQMPLLDGYDATREIRRREEAERRPRVPIIAMTANAMTGAPEACLAAGMDDYIAKPISRAELDEKLASWLPHAAGEERPPSAPAPAAGEDTVLDEARLAELRSLFPGSELPEMLGNLTAEVTAELERINAAVSERDRAVSAAAHRIKNSARMIGAAGLADAASRLEPHGQPGDGDGGAPASGAASVEQLLGRWEETRAAIEAELERAP